MDKPAVMSVLNKILESELAGVVRYTHYAFMIYGYNRIPIVDWLRNEAQSSLQHANDAGEIISSLGEHPSLTIGELLETHKHNIGDILSESLTHEKEALTYYYELLALVKDQSVMLEEYARKLICEEEHHINEVDKMLRNPGDIKAFSA